MRSLFPILVLLLSYVGRAESQDLKETLGRVEKSAGTGDFAAALKEIEWAKSEITQRHNAHLKTFLPDKLGEYQSVEPKNGGFPSFAAAGAGASREYVKLNSETKITVGIQSDIGLQGKFGRLCDPDIARVMPETEIFRVHDYPASFQPQDMFKYMAISVCIEGGVVRFSTSEKSIKDDLKKLAELFDYQKLEAYMKGLK